MNIEEIVIKCIKTILRNENYSDNQINVILNWNYADIKEIIEKGSVLNETN